MTDERYQVCIIGTGAAGGILAHQLAKSGKKTIAIEKGSSVENLDFENTRFPFQRSDLGISSNTTLPMNFEQFGYEYADRHKLYAYGRTNAVADHYRNTFKNYQVFAVGGKTNFWGGSCLRFSQKDFKSKSYGDGQFDWPISYEDVEAYYSAVEELIGVTGGCDHLPDYPDGHFLPPRKPLMADRLLLRGIKSIRNPAVKAIHTRKAVELRKGHAQECQQGCGFCVKGCTSGSRFSFSSRLLPAIKNLSNFNLLPDHGVSKLILNQSKTKIEAVEVIRAQTLEKIKIYADTFILSAGAVESPRILFNSNCDDPSQGIANSSGLVGRYLMDNLKVSVGTALAGLIGVKFMEERGHGSHLFIPRFILWVKKLSGWLYGRVSSC